jgi:NAD(P)-dependent dehydrogenase (short-subunit alcohol dehydrogenase family)
MSNRCVGFSHYLRLRNGHSVVIVSHNLNGKVVVITGGARGIGARLARNLVDAGASVAVLDRDLESAQRLVAELGSATAAFETDVTSAESVAAACGAAARHFGVVDVVVANAGIAGPGSSM